MDDVRVSRKLGRLGDGLEVFGNATMVNDERFFSAVASWFTSTITAAISVGDDIGSALDDLGGIP